MYLSRYSGCSMYIPPYEWLWSRITEWIRRLGIHPSRVLTYHDLLILPSSPSSIGIKTGPLGSLLSLQSRRRKLIHWGGVIDIRNAPVSLQMPFLAPSSSPSPYPPVTYPPAQTCQLPGCLGTVHTDYPNYPSPAYYYSSHNRHVFSYLIGG